MTDHITTDVTGKAPMDPIRKASLIAGLCYIGTFVFSIPALALYDGVLNDPDFVLGSGSDQGVLWGGLIEVLTALTGIGTAIALYPVIKRHGPARSIGFVASRVLEASMIFAGVLAVLSVFTLRQDFGGAAASDPSSLTTTANAFVAFKDWTFLLGPGLMAVVNALCLATILYQTRMVPRFIPAIGLVGAPLLLASSTATLFGGWEQVSTLAMLMVLPIATWEFSLGVYMTVKGLRPAATAPAPERAEVTLPIPTFSAAAV